MNLIIENLELYSRDELERTMSLFNTLLSRVESKPKNLFDKSLLNDYTIAHMFKAEIDEYNKGRMKYDTSVKKLAMSFSFDRYCQIEDIRMWWG